MFPRPEGHKTCDVVYILLRLYLELSRWTPWIPRPTAQEALECVNDPEDGEDLSFSHRSLRLRHSLFSQIPLVLMLGGRTDLHESKEKALADEAV